MMEYIQLSYGVNVISYKNDIIVYGKKVGYVLLNNIIKNICWSKLRKYGDCFGEDL